MKRTELKELRQAVADYMRSEGCSCCRDIDAHERHAERLAKYSTSRATPMAAASILRNSEQQTW